MTYACIFNHYGEIRIRFGNDPDFSKSENSTSISKNLITVLQGEDHEIYRKIYDYAVENGIYLPQLELSDEERIKMLEASVIKLKWAVEKEAHLRRLDNQKHLDKVFELDTIIDLQLNDIATHQLTIDLMEERHCGFQEALAIAEGKTRITFH